MNIRRRIMIRNVANHSPYEVILRYDVNNIQHSIPKGNTKGENEDPIVKNIDMDINTNGFIYLQIKDIYSCSTLRYVVYLGYNCILGRNIKSPSKEFKVYSGLSNDVNLIVRKQPKSHDVILYMLPINSFSSLNIVGPGIIEEECPSYVD